MRSSGSVGERRKQALLEWLRDHPGFYTPGEMFAAGFKYPAELGYIIDQRYTATRSSLQALTEAKLLRRRKKTVVLGQPYLPVGGAGVTRDNIPTKSKKVFCWGVPTNETV